MKNRVVLINKDKYQLDLNPKSLEQKKKKIKGFSDFISISILRLKYKNIALLRTTCLIRR